MNAGDPMDGGKDGPRSGWGMAACGAQTRSGRRCKRGGMPNGRCKLHGGASLLGPTHPNWKGGRYSKYLPDNLAARYATSLQDPQLIALRDEIALLEVRIGQLYEGLGETGSRRFFREAKVKLEAFKAAGSKGKAAVGAARVALGELEQVINLGLTAEATWEELRETFDLKRRLSEAESKRMKDAQQLIAVDQALAIIDQFINEVLTRVNDRAVRAALSTHFGRLLGRAHSEAVAP